MKKIMIAAVIVCAAVMAQAANYKWKETGGQIYQAGGTELVGSGVTAYLFNSSYSQADLIKALFIDKTYSSLADAATANAITAATTATDANSTISTTAQWSYSGVAAEGTWTAYYALVKGDNVFISELSSTITAPSVESPATIKFSNPTFSKDAAMDGTAGFTTAGWYTAAPEPTSGLLLLLGVAGLALKRKRA